MFMPNTDTPAPDGVFLLDHRPQPLTYQEMCLLLDAASTHSEMRIATRQHAQGEGNHAREAHCGFWFLIALET